MKKTKVLSLLFMLCILLGFMVILPTNKVYTNTKNEVTLDFGDGVIEDGSVKYSEVGVISLQRYDSNTNVYEKIDIMNNMTIDLNENEYYFQITELPWISNPDSVVTTPGKVRLTINGWRYATDSDSDKTLFKLDTSKFSGVLSIKLERTNVVINTKVEKIYTDITSKGTIDLTDGKEYVIDFSKGDQLTEGLRTFANLRKTLYYKNENNKLVQTDNENEAVIKIVGKAEENKAILTAVNVGKKKSESFKGMYTGLIKSKLQYDGSDTSGGSAIINETRTDYYNNCTYDFTFKYAEEETKKEDTNSVAKKDKDKDNISNPKTGDSIMGYVTILAISIICSAVLVVIKRK